MRRDRTANGGGARAGRPGDGHPLESLLDAFHSARVLCIGDVMLDRYVHGRVERVSAGVA